MAAVAQGERRTSGAAGAAGAAGRPRATVWGWALWTALLLSAVTVSAVLAPPAPAPLVGAAAVEGAVRRLSYGTARLLESFGAGDATTATVRRAQLLADADATVGALTARRVAARRTVAGQWYADEVERARAYARAAVAYARAGADAGDVRQLERAGGLFVLAMRTLAGAGPTGRQHGPAVPPGEGLPH
jgi:hypothetical protein